MSLIIQEKANEFLKLPPVVDFIQKPIVLIEKGVQSFMPNQLTATSVSNNNIIWNIIPSSFDALIDKRWCAEIDVTFTIVSPDYGQPLYNSFLTGLASLRAYPLNNCISNVNLSINNISTFQQQTNLMIQAAQRINEFQDQINGQLSTAPSQPDTVYNYNLYSTGTINAMRGYADSSFHDFGRGAYQPYSVSSTSSHTALTIAYKFAEYISCPMLLMAGEAEQGLTKNTQLQLQLQLANLTNMLSYNATSLGAWTSVAANINSATLLFNQYNGDIFTRVPEVLTYPYKVPSNVYTTAIGNVTGGSTFSVQAQNIQLTSLPNKCYMWVGRANSTRDYTTSDSFANITSLSVQFDNRSGLLSSASDKQLYQISRDNGLQMSWPQWKSFVGSVMVIDFSKDLGLSSDVAPGVSNFASNFSCQITGVNLDPSVTWNMQLNIVFVSDAVMTVSNSNAITQQSMFTREDVLRAKEFPQVPNDKQRPQIGSGFLSDVHDFVKKNKLVSGVLNVGKTVASAIPHPYAQVASVPLGIGAELANKLGYGRSKKGKGVISGGKRIY